MSKIPLTYIQADQHSRKAHWTSKINHYISQQIYEATTENRGSQMEVVGFLNQKSKNIWEISASDNLFSCKCIIPQEISSKINRGAFIRVRGKVNFLKTEEKVILVDEVIEEDYSKFITEHFTSPFRLPEGLESVFGESENVRHIFTNEITRGAYSENISDALLHLLVGAPVYSDPLLQRTGGIFVSVFPTTESPLGLKRVQNIIQTFSPFGTAFVGARITPSSTRYSSALSDNDYTNVYASLSGDENNTNKARFVNFLHDNRPLGKYFQEQNINSAIVGKDPLLPNNNVYEITPHTEVPLCIDGTEGILQKDLSKRFSPDFLGFVEYHQLFQASYSQQQQDWIVEEWRKEVDALGVLRDGPTSKYQLVRTNLHDIPLNILQLARSMARIEKKESVEKKHMKQAIELSRKTLKELYNYLSPELTPVGIKEEDKRIFAYIKKDGRATREELITAFSTMDPITISASLERLGQYGHIYERTLGLFVVT